MRRGGCRISGSSFHSYPSRGGPCLKALHFINRGNALKDRRFQWRLGAIVNRLSMIACLSSASLSAASTQKPGQVTRDVDVRHFYQAVINYDYPPSADRGIKMKTAARHSRSVAEENCD